MRRGLCKINNQQKKSSVFQRLIFSAILYNQRELKYYYDILKMKILTTNFKKPLITVISSIIIAVIVVILLTSPITKYLIEKNDVKYIGRDITMGRVYVNLFTGYIHIRNLKIYESKSQPGLVESDSVFFSAKGIRAHFACVNCYLKLSK
jgi:hypothetical protein